MRIITLLAHPDDAEIWTGGTLIKHTDRGDEVVVCTFADSDSCRVSEALAGGKVLGTTVQVLDKALLLSLEQARGKVEQLVQEFLPDVVITHWEQDTHPEHRFVQDIVMRVIVSLKITTSYPKVLLACDTYNSIGMSGPFHPTIFVDVSEVWERKINAIRGHQSQPIHLWEDMALCLGRLHGNRCGCTYAEAYSQIPILGRYSSCAFLPDIV